MFYRTNIKKNPLSSYSIISLWSRSFLVFLFSCVTIPIYSFVCVAALLFPLHYRFILLRSYLHMHIYLLKTICHINYHIEGLENIPKDRPVIILSKHQSTWETFFFPLIFHMPAIIIKRELLWVPFFGWGLAVLDPIAINRTLQRNSMQQIVAKGKKCLQRGRSILMFPEGTRTLPGQVVKYKIGGVRLAIETNTPILPIAHNAGQFWRKRKFIKIPGTVHMVIGPLIEVEGQAAARILMLTKNWIEDTMVKIDKKNT